MDLPKPDAYLVGDLSDVVKPPEGMGLPLPECAVLLWYKDKEMARQAAVAVAEAFCNKD